ncbi:hypothetical protein IAD21_00703 [Abditibacteriota bacterium]|nr:hypothetical protein IAD21_00703 [Abditibacteriota bacterium]
MIPRILHRIWLGPQTMPDQFVKFGQSLSELHPTWDIRLWTDDNLPELVNQRGFESAPHESWAANILRYELLLREGGIYLDTDIEPLRPLDDLLDNAAFVAQDVPPHVCNAALGATPGHPFFAGLVEGLSARIAKYPHAPSPIVTGSGYLTEALLRFDKSAPLTILEPRVFFPVPFSRRDHLTETASFHDSFGVHHWAHSWS